MAKKKYISSPAEMEQLFFTDFLNYMQDNPYKKQHWVGKDGGAVTENIMRHPTWMGFEAFLAKEDKIQKLTDYEINKDNRYDKYAAIITRIKAYCRGEVVTAALSGVAQHNLAARIHGIAENVDHDVKVNREVPLFPDAVGNIEDIDHEEIEE